jgi:hypothetical protein
VTGAVSGTGSRFPVRPTGLSGGAGGRSGRRTKGRDDERHDDGRRDGGEPIIRSLVQRIEAEHAAVGQALGSALAHAIAAGELLIEAKRQVSHGEWRPWLEANCKVPARTARHYMALARRKKRLCDQNGNVLPISVHAAVETLKELRGYPHSWPYDPEEMTEFPSGGIAYVPLTAAEIEERKAAKVREWWHVRSWGAFRDTLRIVLNIAQHANPPAPRHVAKAAKAGKTPGLRRSVARDDCVPDSLRRSARTL